MRNWENRYLDIIRGKHLGIIPAFLRTILHLLSFPYRILISLRNHAYNRGWLKKYKPTNAPLIVSIGNIVAGGTGKTPLTIRLAQDLGASIGILSRGYRTADEAKLISERLPEATVVVGKNRCESAVAAIKKGVNLILLDDGFQHRKLHRDYDLLVMDARDPFGLGQFLPRGLLREPVSSLSRAQLIILNHIKDKEHFRIIKEKVERYTTAQIVGSQLQVSNLYDMAGGRMSAFEGKRVGLFCGIARPEYFVETVQHLGMQIVETHFLPDHVGWKEEELRTFIHQCQSKGAQFIICTEKDRVKIDPQKKFDLPIVWVEIELKITEGKSHWNTFISNITNQMKHTSYFSVKENSILG